MKYILLACMALLAIIPSAWAQTQNAPGKTPQQQLDELKGTYELQYNPRQPVTLPSNLAEIIEKNRKENEINTMQLSEKVVLVIYPKNQVQNHK